jgi:ATP-dependent Clp protease ATP-binding subunit ClpC
MIFQLPVYIQQIKSGYLGRPLFFANPSRTDNDLQRLNTKLNRDVVQHLEKIAKAERHDELASWAFSPTMSHLRVKLQLDLRRRTAKAAYLFVTFRHMGKRVAFTPSVPEVWFEYERSESFELRAKTVLEDYWRQAERDAGEGEDVNPEEHALKGQAWVQLNAVSFQIPAKIPKKEASLFMFLGGTGVADGASELRRVGRCLDWLYPNELERAALREEEVKELTRLLNDPDNRPVLLVGPRLVGKTTLIQECVYQRAQGRDQNRNSKGQVWLISPQRLISGMSYVGQWESRLLGILKHAQKREHILYFDDLIGLFLAGRSANSSLNVAQVMKPYLEDRKVRVLGEITPEGLRVLREQDRSFADQFHILPLREASDSDNLRVLLNVQRQLEAKHRCNYDLDVLPTVIELQRRYERSTAFPGKAATVLTRLAIRTSAQRPDSDEAEEQSRRLNPLFGRVEIHRSDVFVEFTGRTGLSLEFLDPLLRLDRDHVRDLLQEQVVGQTDAIEALADIVSIAKARLNDPDRPLAAFLFLGPTGVGKTESAKAVARTLFGNEDRLLRFDLNEFNQPGSAARLVGTLSQPEGLLTSAIRRQPFAVILLDEIEKAEPDVFDVLLQVLGEGRLTDALGRTADFTNAILILTSNLGVREAEGGVGFFANPDQSGSFTRAAERFFRPEFFNRLDRVIPFRKLTRDEMGRIAKRLVDAVLQREGFSQRQCVLDVSTTALDRVIEAGYDPVLGARAMKRAVEQQLARPAAARLAALSQGSLTIVSIGASDTALTVQVQSPMTAERVHRESHGTPAERIENYRTQLEPIDLLLDELRPKGGISGKVTRDQERYYTLKELADSIAAQIDRVEDYLDQQRLTRLGAGSPGAMGRRPRYRAITEPKGYGIDGGSALRILASAQNMEQAIEEVLQELTPIDEDQELYEIDRRLSLLRLMANCIPDEKPVYLWIRGYPEGADSAAVQQLAKLYLSSWNQQLGVESQAVTLSHLLASERLLEVQGVHARALAQREVGTHLFMPKHGGPIPVRVELLDHQPTAVERKTNYGDILRIYPHEKPIIDLRSGLIAQHPVQPEMMAAFVLASLE